MVEFDRLVALVMGQEPYASGHRVFWMVDNAGIHRGKSSIRRLEGRWPNLRLIHPAVHSNWLNRIEIYFSILQRKAWTPDDFSSFEEAEARILGFQSHYQTIARPFGWAFDRHDLARLLARNDQTSVPSQPRAA